MDVALTKCWRHPFPNPSRLIRINLPERSELRVKPTGENRNWPAIGIVSGVIDELIVEGQCRPFAEAIRIIGLNDLLSPIIELAVANQNTEATGRKICPRFRRKT